MMKKTAKNRCQLTLQQQALISTDDIAEEAYERCGLQVRSGYDLQTTRRSLNLLLAEWANRGLNLWTIQLQEKQLHQPQLV